MTTMSGPLRSIDDILATARKHAHDGWRPTHQEIRQMLELIDRQAEQLARQPIGYAAAFTLNDGSTVISGDGPEQDEAPVFLYEAVPLPFELSPTERVVAVYELPA